jgi:mRNA interferase RelE/StbE
MEWQIIVLPTAKKHLKAISDQRIQKSIIDCIENLKDEPEKQGKPLSGSLAGYRSIRAFRQRYRIVYEVDVDQSKVLIHVVGIRKDGDRMDVYALAKRILRLGLF